MNSAAPVRVDPAALIRVDPAALARRFPGDSYLRWQLATPDDGTAAWALGRAWARVDTVDGRTRLVAGGNPADTAALLAAVVPGRAVPDRVSIARDAVDLLPELLRPVGGDDWDWFATTTAPAEVLPGEEAAVRIDVADPLVLAAVLDLLDGHSPRHSRDPRQADAGWWAIPDPTGSGNGDVRVGAGGPGARLAAVSAVEPLPRAVHLASIATRTELRGRGFGSALTAAVTRAALAEGCEAVVLGMYADNDTARRVYRRLGFVDSHRWRSGHLRALTGAGAAAAPR